jgi:hypothetical protein
MSQSLELDATPVELSNLVASVVPCHAAHVLLSSNVFTSALRAIALAIAQSSQVFVRPSRREATFARLLHEAAPEAFTIVQELRPLAGDHLWAYGSDETMAAISGSPWPDVVLHAHGYGYGILAVSAPEVLSDSDFTAMAIDICAFDQRGCLSPKLALVCGNEKSVEMFAMRLSGALEQLSETMPIGHLADAELAARARHRELWRYLGTCFESAAALVTLDVEQGPATLAPGCRSMHIRRVDDLVPELLAQEAMLTSVGTSEPDIRSLSGTLPRARVTHFGRMQRPPLDGPADRRTPLSGHSLSGLNL